MKIKINRQLAGVEDLAWGTGTVIQQRAGELVEITEINAGNMPFDESLSLKEALDTKYAEVEKVGQNIEVVTQVAENIINVNLIGDNIDSVITTAREIVAIVNVHLNMTDITLMAEHTGHLEIIGNDLVEQGTKYIHDLGSITEEVEIPQKGKSDIITVSDNIHHVKHVSENMEDVNHVSEQMTSVNIVGEDLMHLGFGRTLDAGYVKDPVEETPSGISYIETVAANIDSVVIDAENIEDIIKVAESIDKVNLTGDNIASVDIIGRDLSLTGLAYIVDCGEVNDPVITPPQTQSNIVEVAENIDDVNAVALHINGVIAIAEDLANGQIGSKIDGGLIVDPVDYTNLGQSNIEIVATNISDIITCGQNIQIIIDGYNAAQLAIQAEIMAEKWAEEDFNVEVEPGKYSAKHWATVASTIVGNGVIDDSMQGLATTYSSDKIVNLIGASTTDVLRISNPDEGTLAMYNNGQWEAVDVLDLGII